MTTITEGWLDGCSKMYKFCPFCNILTAWQYDSQGRGELAEMAHQYKIKSNRLHSHPTMMLIDILQQILTAAH